MLGRGLYRCVPEAVPVQLLEQDRSELRLSEWHEADPFREHAQTPNAAEQVMAVAGKVPGTHLWRHALLRDQHGETASLDSRSEADAETRPPRLL